MKVLERIEERYMRGGLVIAPGGWCCWCHCTCSTDVLTEEEL